MIRPRKFWTIWCAALLACCIMVGPHLRAQVSLTGVVLSAPVASGGSTNAWSASDKSVSITLSGTPLLLTAARSGTGGYAAGRAVDSTSTGVLYWEESVDTSPGAEFILDGFSNAAAALSDFGGQSNNSVAYDMSAGLIWMNGASTNITVTAAQNDLVGYVLDNTNKKFYVRVIHLGVAGNWNGNGSANPCTNTGGFDFSTLNAGPYFALYSLGDATRQITANFGASAFSAAKPSCASTWP